MEKYFELTSEFADKVNETHGDSQNGKVYRAIIEVIKLRFTEAL
jgi:hypothetical protein